MKVLIYSHAFAPQIGGIETFATYLSRGLALARSGKYFNVTVVTKTPGPLQGNPPDTPFEVVREPSIWRLWKLIGSVKQVLLIGPAILPLLLGLLRRKHVIVTHHGYQAICPNGMLFHFPTHRTCVGHFAARRYLQCVNCNAEELKVAGSARLLFFTFMRRALSCFATSNVAVSEHVARRVNLPRPRVIRNGVPECLADSSAVAAGPHNRKSLCFAYLGRLVTEKGVAVLIEAAAVLKARDRAFEVLIIGDGPERNALQAHVSAVGLENSVKFAGFRMGTQLNDIMSAVSALVMPSICEDAAPFSVLEQMMQRRLIIGSRIGGLAEEIGDAGLTFAAGDALELADQMERVIAEPELVEHLGNKARERALRNYGLDRMLLEYEQLIAAPRG